MKSNRNLRKLASDSQNFTLHLSEGSTIDDTQGSVSTNNKTADTNDIIVISDSSSNSSYEDIDVPDPKSTSDFNIKNKKKTIYPRSCFLEIFSDDEEEKLDRPWRMLGNAEIFRSLDKYGNKTAINCHKTVRKTINISDETAINSSDTNCDEHMENRINKRDAERSCETPTSTLARKYDVKQTDKMITPNNSTHCSKVFSRLNQFQTRSDHTPQHNSAGKTKLTKQDTQRIYRNISQKQITYDSPREGKETNIIIDESTDEDVIHPAVSPRSNKKLMYQDGNRDVTDTSLRANIISDSPKDPPKSTARVHISHRLDTPRQEELHRPLSKTKRRQIAEWLMTNSLDSRSDSSCSNVPASTRNSRDSGNSSLDRLELKYETPNNRGKVNKTQSAQQSDGKQMTIVDTGRVLEPISPRQTTIDRFIQKSGNDNPVFKTPDRLSLSPKADKGISTATEPSEIGITDYTDILDKLYGKSWRDKANMLLTGTEPRKTSIQMTNRAVQTERKPLSNKQHYITDSESDSDSGKNKIKTVRRKKDRQRQKQRDSFINDESLSDNESTYYTALTNPKTSTNSTTSKPMPVSASVRRIRTICDTDTEDSSHESSGDSKKIKKKLFNDDKGSSTSEFDPGDYVPPKHVYRKETGKTLQPFKTASRSAFTNNSVTCKSFLASLSNTVPMSNAHPDAQKYRLDYKNNKEALCKKLYKLYNEKVFDDKLPQDMLIEWNIRMRGTAGYCYNKKSVRTLSGIVKSSRIVVATKILDTPDRLRDTLIHEMCHAAAWLLNNVSDGHGPFWTGWANKAMKMFPELPPIRRCHDYDIKTKFTYRCTGCGYSIGRHSKSLDVEKKRCGHCYSKFELLINKTTKSGTIQVQTPKKEPTGFALYVKQNYNSVRKERNNVKHADVMKILGQQFSAIKIDRKNNLDMPE